MKGKKKAIKEVKIQKKEKENQERTRKKKKNQIKKVKTRREKEENQKRT